jgi:uncharacterized surface protein with fasciclin (FAS1) repeats
LVAAPLAALGFSAQAADVVSTIQSQQQFSTLAKAIKAGGIANALQGGGPYTVFAPTDQAFAQLPPGTIDYLMRQDNQVQLKKLLRYHVVQGKELQADQLIGKETKVGTLEGDSLSVKGTGRMVLLVPTGARSTQPRQASATDTGAGQQQAQTEVTQQSNMPATQHQEQVLKGAPPTEQRQTMADTQSGMPATKHQREVLRGQQPGEQGGNGQQMATDAGAGQQMATDAGAGQQQAQTEVTQQSNMPATQHQEQVLKGAPPTEQRQTMADTQSGMPATKHQREVLRGQQPGEQGGNGQQMGAPEAGPNQGDLRQATVIGGPIKADNGVIYAIDGVLVPQSILAQVEKQGQSR